MKLLNVTEITAENEGLDYNEIDSIRSTYIYKIAQKFEPENDVEVHLNAATVLTELADYKAVFYELITK